MILFFSKGLFDPLKKIRVAIIGAGYMATEHIKAFSRLPRVQLTGITSRTRTRAEQLAEAYSELRVYDSIAQMHAATKADLVVVCVRELDLLGVCGQSFSFPWMHLVEKPLGHDLREARTIHQMSLDRQARVYAAFNRRFYSSTLQAVKLLEGDGSRRMVTILDQEDTDGARASGQPEAVVENWMFANAVHLIDLFHVFCRGNLETVRPLQPWRGLATELVVGELVYDSGDIGLYQALWNRPGPWSVAVSTCNRRLEMRPVEKVAEQLAGSRVNREQEQDPLDRDFKPGLFRMAAVRGEKHALTTIDDSLQSMELVAALYGKTG